MTTTTCSRCNAAMAAGAQFCGSCGAPQGAAAPPPPIPQPPPFQQPMMPQMARGFSGATGGANKQATFSGSAQDAFNQALNAINAAGLASKGTLTSQVTWQQPPSAAKFETICKSTWTTLGFAIKYDGDLQVQPAGPGQVTARYSLKLQWGSAMGLIIAQGAMVLIAAMFNWAIAAYALFFIVGSMAFTAWNLASNIPERTLTEFVKHLQGGGAPMAGFATPSHQPAPQPFTPAPQPFTPAPAPAAFTPAPQPAPAGGGGDAATIMEQIKQLGGLRDAGVLTPEEFEAKKAELLKRI